MLEGVASALSPTPAPSPLPSPCPSHQLAGTLKSGGVKTGAVNCDKEAELCRNVRTGQTGRPALRLVHGQVRCAPLSLHASPFVLSLDG